MTSSLILVRHAAVHVDPAVESHRWQLTSDGRSATQQLASKLQPYQPSRIFTSHEPKAITTGAVLAAQLHLSGQQIPGLQEHDRHGVPYFESKVDFETAVANFFTHPDELVFGGETAVQAHHRFSEAVDNLCQTHPTETLILTSHGTVLTLYICHHNPDLVPLTFWRSLTMPCAFVLRLPDKQLVRTIFV